MSCAVDLRSLSLALFVSLASFSATGCAGFNAGSLSLGNMLAGFEQEESLPEGAPSVRVELHFEDNNPTASRVAFTEGMRASDAIEKARAASRFQRMKISVIRKSSEDGKQQVMHVKWDNARQSVPITSDYSLQADDRIIIKEDPSSFLDEFFGPAFGPISKSLF